MKTILSILTVSLFAAAPGHSPAAAILHYDDFTGGTEAVSVALASLGELATTTSHGSFATDLALQAWDLVIVDISNLSIGGSNSAAIINYLGLGGRVMMSYWNLDNDAALATAFESSVATSFSSLQPTYVWVPGNPIFTTPNPVASPVVSTPESLGDNGDELNTVGGGVAIAGFSTTPTPGRAAIIVGNGGNSIVNGFSMDEIDPASGLIANQIAFLLIPEPGRALLLCIGAMFGLVARRRR